MGALKLVGALALIGFTILFVLPTSMQLVRRLSQVESVHDIAYYETVELCV